MKALAFLLLSFPVFSWAHLVGLQALDPHFTPKENLKFDFGKVPLNETYYTIFTLNAPKDKDLKISEIGITGEMFQGYTECGDTLPKGTSCDSEIDFTPTSLGPHKGQFWVRTDQGDVVVDLTGEGVEAPSN